MRESRITLRAIRATSALIQTTEHKRQTPDEFNDAAKEGAALVNNKENTSAAADTMQRAGEVREGDHWFCREKRRGET